MMAANKLAEKRRLAGMTQLELAEASGVNVRVLQEYEQGRRPLNGIRGITLYRLAKAVGCEIEELLTIDE